MIVCTFVLVVWAVVLKAPLEAPATTAKAPNPSKAPWYFLGLQEMLVYYDPWMAGVVLPTMIIVGLMAMPYIDFNRKGNGYFTFEQRLFAITMFMFGFLVLWVTLIVLGTFLRGPNWNFFGPYEYWDPHKVLPLNNVNVSELFWLKLLHQPLEGMNRCVRELPGLCCCSRTCSCCRRCWPEPSCASSSSRWASSASWCWSCCSSSWPPCRSRWSCAGRST